MQGRDERAREDRGGMDHLAATPHKASDAGRSQENLDAAVYEQVANHVAYLAHQRLYQAVNDPWSDRSLREQSRRASAAKDQGTGVRWVRPAELMYQASAGAAGVGIRWVASLNQRGHNTVVRGARHIARQTGRLRRLPPLSAFGNGRTKRRAAPGQSEPGL